MDGRLKSKVQAMVQELAREGGEAAGMMDIRLLSAGESGYQQTR